MSEYAYNVWIEIEQVEVVDGCDSFHKDHSTAHDYGKAGRFDSLDEAVDFGNRLSRCAIADSDGGDSLADSALAGLASIHKQLQLGKRPSFGPPSTEVAAALCELMNNVGLEVH